ncbi:MAG: hypothetical protein ACYDB7_08410 [Mycobacteriales bacterium]
MTASTLSGGGGSVKCTWSPPVLEYLLPLHTGQHWSSVSTCTVTIAGTPSHVRRTMSASVLGTGRYTAGGSSTVVWLLHREDDITVTGTGYTFTSDSTSSESFSPTLGLVVESNGASRTKATYQGKTYNETGTLAIQALSLQPS